MSSQSDDTKQPREWLTKAEAAEYAGVHVDTIERAIKSGHLRAGRPRGTRNLLRIRRAWLDAWLAGSVVVAAIRVVLLTATLLFALWLACLAGSSSAEQALRVMHFPPWLPGGPDQCHGKLHQLVVDDRADAATRAGRTARTMKMLSG